MAIRKRTRGRELALQHLYAVDVRRDGDRVEVEPFLRMQTNDDQVYLFATGLVHGCLGNLERIDAEIRRVADHWELNRLAAVDRNILRLGVHELLDRVDIPPQVTLNEAIELAKKFSTARSGAFVNGILDRIRRDLGRRPDDSREPSRVLLSPTPAREPEGDIDEPALDAFDDPAGDPGAP